MCCPLHYPASKQTLAVAEGFEPSMAALTVRCLTSLATPQRKSFFSHKEAQKAHIQLCFVCLFMADLVATRVSAVDEKCLTMDSSIVLDSNRCLSVRTLCLNQADQRCDMVGEDRVELSPRVPRTRMQSRSAFAGGWQLISFLQQFRDVH